tara:strand:- start:204 stop:566 length:363 start_codon:yes stop_codon:yes gene_type:complete
MNIKWKNKTIEPTASSTKPTTEKVLHYYCITCGFVKEYTKDTIPNPKLYQQQYEIDKSFITFNNELLCEDPTLQKIDNPDIQCPTCKDTKEQNIIYYIYDIDNMKYLYICCHCKSSWKTE